MNKPFARENKSLEAFLKNILLKVQDIGGRTTKSFFSLFFYHLKDLYFIS